MTRNAALLALAIATLLAGCGTSTVSMRIVQPAPINAQRYGGTVSVSQIMAMQPEHEGAAADLARQILIGVRGGYGGVVQAVSPPGGIDISGTVEQQFTEVKAHKYDGTCKVRTPYNDAKGKRRYKTTRVKCRKGYLGWRTHLLVMIRITGSDGRTLWQRRLRRSASGRINPRDQKDIRNAVREIKRMYRDARRAAHRSHSTMRRNMGQQVAAMVVPRQVRVRVKVYDCKGGAGPHCVRGAKQLAGSQFDASLASYAQALQIYAQTPGTQNVDAAKVHWNRALVCRFAHRYNAAHAELTKALQLDPGNSSYIAERQRIEKARADEARLNAQGLARPGAVGPAPQPQPMQPQPVQPQPGPSGPSAGYPQPAPQPAPQPGPPGA